MVSDTTIEYITSSSVEHRKKLCQFFTHDRVADFMVQWVSSKGTVDSLYDPAFGLGAFYQAALRQQYQGKIYGAEIDEEILNFVSSHVPQDIKLTLTKGDYLTSWGKSKPGIVCNPPYMRFQKFEDRERTFAEFEKRLNIRLSGYTNIASAFLIKSLHELRPGGRLAYIMPLEFLNTGYGKIVKKQLLEQGQIRAFIKIDCEKDVFPEVTTSVGIILFEKVKTRESVPFFVLTRLADLEQFSQCSAVTQVDAQALSPDKKWLQYFERQNTSFDIKNLVPLRYYGAFNRGIATGANEFFVLNREKASTLGLRSHEIVPCITKSAQIKHPIFTELNLKALMENNDNVFLMSIHGKPSHHAAQYIQVGEKFEFHQRYLTKNRNPWYKTEERLPAPLLFGVFSRGGFKLVRNYTQATYLTCYHGFYPNIFGTNLVDHLFLFFSSKAGKSLLSQQLRRYGDALDKFEPNDLNAVLCPSMESFAQLHPQEIACAISDIKTYGKLSDSAERLFASLVELKRVAKERYV
jgi:adenine-specific DNA-methyltransferase